MIGVLIVTHGQFGKELLRSCELITGKLEKVEALSLEKDDDINDLSTAFKTKVKELNQGDGLIVFVDMLGGSPSNIGAIMLKKEGGFKLISGVNLPMLVEVVLSREIMDIEELTNQLIVNGRQSIKYLNEELK